MKHTMLLAPAAFFAVGLFATSSQAHGTVAVGLPPVVIDTGGVTIAIGVPPPPPPVVVVEQPRQERVVVVERAPPPPPRQTVVYVREREPQRVVYVDDRCDHPGRGNHYGKHKHQHVKHHGHHGGHDDDRGRGNGRGDHHGKGHSEGHGNGGKHRGFDT